MFATCWLHFSDWLTVIPSTLYSATLSTVRMLSWWGVACQPPENHFLCLSGVDVHSVVRRPWYQFIHSRLDWLNWRLLTTSEIVVSSINLCVIIPGFRWSITISNTRGPSQDRYLRHPFSRRDPVRKKIRRRLSADTCCKGKSWSNQWWCLAVVTSYVCRLRCCDQCGQMLFCKFRVSK